LIFITSIEINNGANHGTDKFKNIQNTFSIRRRDD